jgi:hypothetical protein
MPELANQITSFDDSSLLVLTESKLLSCSLPLPLLAQESSPPTFQELLQLAPNKKSDHKMAIDRITSSVMVISGKVLHVGTLRKKDPTALELPFSWMEMAIQNDIASIASHGGTVALGEVSGDIHLYFDLIESLKKNQVPTDSLVKWHQSPITSLNLSFNGISFLAIRLLRSISYIWSR